MNTMLQPLTRIELVCFTVLYLLFLTISLFFVSSMLFAAMFALIPYCIVGALYVLIREMR